MSVFDKLAVRPPLAIGTAESTFIEAVRSALKEYDRATKPDGRRNNGKRRVNRNDLKKALGLLDDGYTIRHAAGIYGLSYGTLWKAKEARRKS